MSIYHLKASPAYRVKGKILVNWIEFKKWIQGFRYKGYEFPGLRFAPIGAKEKGKMGGQSLRNLADYLQI
jgi:hypothetical protein